MMKKRPAKAAILKDLDRVMKNYTNLGGWNRRPHVKIATLLD